VIGPRLWTRLARIPHAVRWSAARVMTRIPPATWDGVGSAVDRALPASRRGVITGNSVHKLAMVLPVGGVDEMYRRLASNWPEPGKVVMAHRPAMRGAPASLALDPTHRMMLDDLMTYLPDDILVKVDRASMGTSLEARAPLLDHRVVEFAWRLPLDQKIRAGEGKWILRRVLERHLPRAMFERPKHGFGVPIDAWLRGPLREWTTDLLSEDRLRRDGFFDPAPIRAALAEHLTGRTNRQYRLWTILMFQAWLDEQARSTARP